MKKKILIIMPSMFIGGAERSLIGLLESFDYDAYDVNLFLYRHEGEFLKYIPAKTNLLKEMKEYTTFDRPIRDLIFSRRFLFGAARIASKLELNIRCAMTGSKKGTYKTMQFTSRYLLPLLPRIPGSYDLAINFLGIHDVLAKKVNAKIKIGWLHTDYSILDPFLKLDYKMWSKLDYIVNVSEECTKAFLKLQPGLAERCVTIENILSPEFVRSQAKGDVSGEMPNEEGVVKLLSIGRYSYAKNFDNAVDICHRLLQKGVGLRWYIIGYGGEEETIRQKIREYRLENNFILLGKRENPYPYIKACDIYVQPSRYEGKAVTVREAQILCKPVVITDYLTAKQQLEDGFDGIIVPLNNAECAEGLLRVIKNRTLQEKLILNCSRRDYSNRGEIEKIYRIAESRTPFIPQIIHYCWFGHKEKPKKIIRCIESWKKFLPEFRIIEWNETNFNILAHPYANDAYKAGKYAFVSDIARIRALKEYGGLYFDTDVEVLKPFGDILNTPFLLGFEEKNYVATSFMACIPGHPLNDEFLSGYEGESFVLPNGSYNMTTNVKRLTEILQKNGLILNGKYQELGNGIKVYPQKYFSPYDYINCVYQITEESCCIHHFYVTWKSGKEQIKKTMKTILVKIVGRKNLIKLRQRINFNGD